MENTLEKLISRERNWKIKKVELMKKILFIKPKSGSSFIENDERLSL